MRQAPADAATVRTLRTTSRLLSAGKQLEVSSTFVGRLLSGALLKALKVLQQTRLVDIEAQLVASLVSLQRLIVDGLG